jgi:hypothetical protein
MYLPVDIPDMTANLAGTSNTYTTTPNIVL